MSYIYTHHKYGLKYNNPEINHVSSGDIHISSVMMLESLLNIKRTSIRPIRTIRADM